MLLRKLTLLHVRVRAEYQEPKYVYLSVVKEPDPARRYRSILQLYYLKSKGVARKVLLYFKPELVVLYNYKMNLLIDTLLPVSLKSL